MLQSKKVKEKKEIKPKNKAHELAIKTLSLMEDYLYYPFIYPVVRFYKKVRRALEYAYFSWDNHDWDFAYVYSLMKFKMEKVHKSLKEGHLEQDKEVLSALKRAIDTVERLCEDKYEDPYYELHSRKWGYFEWEFEPFFDKNGRNVGSSMRSKRENVKSKQDEKQERLEYLEIHKKADQDRAKDIERFAEILKKYDKQFWD